MKRFLRPRVIPVLLLQGEGLVKSVSFGEHRYIGDPINAVKIYNDSEVDEIVLLDIRSGVDGKSPQFEKLTEIVSESFIPLTYGGAIRTIEDAERLIKLGIEKLSFNTACFKDPELIRRCVNSFGSSAVVASIDVRKSFFSGYECYVSAGTQSTKCKVSDFLRRVEDLGVGEILLTSIDHEGRQKGLDLKLIELAAQIVKVPLIAHGGVGELNHIKQGILYGANAVAAGSLFVYHGKLNGILINYPKQEKLKELFQL